MKKIFLLIIIFTNVFRINDCFAQNSRVDLEYTFLPTSYHANQTYFTDEESNNLVKHGFILSFRYKIDILSNLEIGFSTGYFNADFYYGGILLGVDLKYMFYDTYFIESSFKPNLGLIIMNRGSDHNPDRRFLYSLFSFGIGKEIFYGLELSANIYIPSRTFVGEKSYTMGGYYRKEYLYSILSLKLSYCF